MSLWTKFDSNPTHTLWETRTPGGSTLRVPGRADHPPPDWLVKHHVDRFGDNPPKAELGTTGVRFLFPGETEWREYGYTPRKS